jgi:CheY-like chemotaxis protein
MNSSPSLQDDVELVTIIDPIPFPKLMTDEGRFSRVLMNLVSNAIKFTVRGNVTVMLSGPLMNDMNDLCSFNVVVQDTGRGMDTNDVKYARKAHVHCSEREGGGTGLGLSICDSIINAMGGEMEIDSQTGIGTRITFSVTMKIAIQQEQLSLSSQPDSKEECGSSIDFTTKVITEPAEASLHYMNNVTNPLSERSHIRFLLADDMPLLRKLGKNMLDKLCVKNTRFQGGNVTHVAENGQKALEMILEASEPYDIVFMDINMPGMRGDVATRMLREIELKNNCTGFQRQYVCALTGDAIVEENDGCFDGLSTKPSTPLALASQVLKMLNKRYLESDIMYG